MARNGPSAENCKNRRVLGWSAWIWKKSLWSMLFFFEMEPYIDYVNVHSNVCRWSLDQRQQSELHFLDHEGAEHKVWVERSWWGEVDSWYGKLFVTENGESCFWNKRGTQKRSMSGLEWRWRDLRTLWCGVLSILKSDWRLGQMIFAKN